MPQQMSFIACWGLLVVFAAAPGCRTFDVHADWDQTIQWQALGRFYFEQPPRAEGADPFADNTLLRKRVRNAVEVVMAERDYLIVETPDEADFLVTFDVQLEERVRAGGLSSTVGSTFPRRGIGVGSVYSTTNVKVYQESTLLVDFLDPTSRDLLWRGWGTGMLGTRDRDRGPQVLLEGVRAILRRFPPEQGRVD
jgi:hypothetical protein